ncbi:DUF805 domain-containing protein [Streptomyces sp. NBC_01515]|uniref:DUF805 domain-containing protein n=1 Tax=Streptomyces sp. NBC_01515 TaxID=2903890 RepID=UPI003870CCB9
MPHTTAFARNQWFSVLYTGAAALIVGISFAIAVPLLNVLLVPFIVPMLSVSARRLHDAGESGGRMLTALTPTVGPTLYRLGMTVDSAPGTHQYGPSPKAADQPAGSAGHVVRRQSGRPLGSAHRLGEAVPSGGRGEQRLAEPGYGALHQDDRHVGCTGHRG